jgi:hypothetical protein
MKRTTSTYLKRHLKEVSIVEPNDLGYSFLTVPYRRIALFFKTAPFIVVVPLALIGATGLVYVFGILAIKLVSLLQYGF